MKKLALFLACALFLGITITSCASTDDSSSSTATSSTTSSGTAAPREFVCDFEDYYTLNGDSVTVTEDPNWDIFEDTVATVSLKDSQGPTEFSVTTYYKEDSAASWTYCGSGTVELGGTPYSFSIPENYTFKVTAQATAGHSGNAAMTVSLK